MIIESIYKLGMLTPQPPQVCRVCSQCTCIRDQL